MKLTKRNRTAITERTTSAALGDERVDLVRIRLNTLIQIIWLNSTLIDLRLSCKTALKINQFEQFNDINPFAPSDPFNSPPSALSPPPRPLTYPESA
jgi:hypothetical protein